MSENKIKVTATTSTKPVRVSVSTPTSQGAVTLSQDTSAYNANLAQQWANSENIVLGQDYSSKYYANKAKESATNAEGYAQSSSNLYNETQQIAMQASETIIAEKNNALTEIETTKSEAVNSLTTAKNEAVEGIENASEEQKKEITDLANVIKENAEDIASRTSFAMFDTVLKDHILTYKESKGLALQGTYVYKEAVAGSRYGYPDFYNKCLEEKESATITEVTLGDTTITMYVNANGHQYYDIANKDVVDAFFETMGSAWFYGIDIENERIFLPRNVWFEQMSMDDVGKAIQAGLPNITGTFCIDKTSYGWSQSSISGVFYNAGEGANGNSATQNGKAPKVGFDASRSNPIYGNSDTVQPNAVKKLLYICVGNTVADTSWVDVVTQVKEGTKDIQEAKDEAIDELKNIAGGTVPLGFIGSAILGIDETLGLQRYLNGQIIIQDQFKGFTKFLKRRIELYPSLACTEDEWQTTVTMSAFSQCGKFVVDDNAKTIRLPKVVNIQGLTDLSKLGEIVEAGLPSHTHSLTLPRVWGSGTNANYGTAWGGDDIRRDSLTATTTGASNSIYGKSNTVQQEQIQYPYFIQVATGAETEDNIINEIELNNPFSLLDYKYSEYELNNLSWLCSNGQYNSKAVYPAVYDLLLKIYNGTETKAGVSVKLSTEAYTDYDFVLNTADETFRLPIKVKLASGKAIVGNGMTLGLTNGNAFSGLGVSGMALANDVNIYGDKVARTGFTINNGLKDLSIAGVTTDPTKSGIETSDSDLYLYFYVGETVQNANLINAGRIEEKIADLIPDNKNIIMDYVAPDRISAITYTITQGATINFPDNGWIILSVSGNATFSMDVKGTVSSYVGSLYRWGRASEPYRLPWFPVAKGEYSIFEATNVDCLYFVPMKGAN